MRNLLTGAIAATAIVLALATPAAAAVRYDFTADSSFGFGTDDAEFFAGSFTYTAAGFITPDFHIDVGDLDSCSATSNLGPVTCGDAQFLDDISPGYQTVSFGIHGVTTDVGIFYYFADGAFGAAGTYELQIFGSDQHGTLVVTDLDGGVGGVPEPGTWAMLLLGFGGIGGAIRARRRTGALQGA